MIMMIDGGMRIILVVLLIISYKLTVGQKMDLRTIQKQTSQMKNCNLILVSHYEIKQGKEI